ncbi:hypothetical protein [Streptomyces sp. NPDC012508]|uniref:hypothetical protein n=1 Tax=Streptomyces sp. NPDC012508 TaxID=3364837 RepID=UPI003685D938
MGELLNAAVGFPTLLLTAALVVVIGFWLLVLCGAAGYDAFDSDVDTDALKLGRLPVAVAASVFVAVGWFLSLFGAVLLEAAALQGALSPLLSLLLLFLAPFVSWRVTGRLVRPLAALFPDEPGPSREDVAGLT